MCQFFSSLSNDKGEVYFLTPEKVVEVMCSGNKGNYDFNSHTSIAQVLNLDEDKCAKWEYNPESSILELDSGSEKFREIVLEKMKEFFNGKDIVYLRNLFGRNVGYWNVGYQNVGYQNVGNRNVGNRNVGDWNVGNRNVGNRNAGNRNVGYWNAGYQNVGNQNVGYWNVGYQNVGNQNVGYRNVGNQNVGDCNVGNCNSGTTIGSFCTHKIYYLFNERVTEQEFNKSQIYVDLPICTWVDESGMTDEEKEKYPTHKTCCGFLKTLEYKEAWKEVSKEDIERIKKLPKFNEEVFKEITGLSV